MILHPPLGDVVQEKREIQAPCDWRSTATISLASGSSSVSRCASSIGEIADGAQEMLVDRVMMIHVELHQRDDAAEFGDETAEHAGFVHQPQHDFRRVARRQNAEKQPVGFGVGAQLGVDELERR